jgi:dynein heavy chain
VLVLLTLTPSHRAQVSNRFLAITAGGEQIHKLASDSSRAVEVNKADPPWRNYVDYINQIVTDGFVRAVKCSLDYLAGFMDSKHKDELPLLELRLELQGDRLIFVPDIDGGAVFHFSNTTQHCALMSSIQPRARRVWKSS